MADNTWARLEQDVAVEILTLPDTFEPGVNIFHSDLTFVKVTAQPGVAKGWIRGADGTFVAPPVVQPSKSELTAHADAARDAIMTGGITVDIGTSDKPVVVSVSTNDGGLADILGLERLDDLGHPIEWYESTGMTPITRAQLDTIGVAAGLFRGACYAVWSGLVQGIEAGSITTLAAIAGTSWPATTR